MPPPITLAFSTSIYRAKLGGPNVPAFLDELRIACRAIAQEDASGQAWSHDASYAGYTSYASIHDLPERSPTFAALCERLGPHLAAFAADLDFDLRGHIPVVDSIWVNILEPGGSHTGHIHTNSVISGTFYVDVPDGASAIRFEDPRLDKMMAAPPRKARATAHNKPFVSVQPSPGTVLLWESWLRHEVPVNRANQDRISISFNAVLV
jgi:uncharacterized protein (TIGR02466 family)